METSDRSRLAPSGRARRPHGRFGGALIAFGLVTATARADAPDRVLEDVGAVRDACEISANEGPRHLYSVSIASTEWRFLGYDPESEQLTVDTRRNLRALGGSFEVFPSHLEPIGFSVSPERARALVELASTGLSLRLGFFLGFDEPSRTACVVRPAVGVTTARVDVAFVELVDRDGQVVAREETDRLRAYLDDVARDRVPGAGVRAALTPVELVRGPALSAAQRRAFSEADAMLRAQIVRCYGQARDRGAPDEAQVLVRIAFDPATGGVSRAEATLSTLGDEDATSCVATAFRQQLRLPGLAPGAPVVVETSVRLAAD